MISFKEALSQSVLGLLLGPAPVTLNHKSVYWF